MENEDELMEDSSSESEKEDDVNNLSSIFNDPYATPATELLDVNYDTYMVSSKESLKQDINIFGLSFYGDGATVKRMPLLNILASGAYSLCAYVCFRNCKLYFPHGQGWKKGCFIYCIALPTTHG